MQLAAQRIAQEAAAHPRARSVHTIESNAKIAAADGFCVDVTEHSVDMQPRGILPVAGNTPDFGVGGLVEIALMIQVEQLAPFVVVEEQSDRKSVV